MRRGETCHEAGYGGVAAGRRLRGHGGRCDGSPQYVNVELREAMSWLDALMSDETRRWLNASARKGDGWTAVRWRWCPDDVFMEWGLPSIIAAVG